MHKLVYGFSIFFMLWATFEMQDPWDRFRGDESMAFALALLPIVIMFYVMGIVSAFFFRPWRFVPLALFGIHVPVGIYLMIEGF